MSRIRNLEQVRRQVDCRDYLTRYIDPGPVTRECRKACCPFHQDHTPSLAVYADHFHCFGCRKSGDVFTFVQEIRGVDFREAVEIVAEDNGIELQYEDSTSGRTGRTRKDLREALLAAQRHYRGEFQESEAAREYAAGRGLTPELCKEWRIGYARASTVTDVAETELLYEAGVLQKGKNGEFFDPLAGRMIIPHTDRAGRVTGFSGRRLTNGKSSEPKYLDTRGTRLFEKSRQLYGYASAHSLLIKAPDGDPWLVVEGELAVIAAQQAGYAAVAPAGSTMTEDQARMLKGHPVFLAYDRDKAGREATEKAIPRLRKLEVDVRIAVLRIPDGASSEDSDPDDLLARGLPIEYSSMDVIDWAVRALLPPDRTDPSWSRILTKRILPLTEHRTKTAKWMTLKKLSRLVGIPLDILISDQKDLQTEIESQTAYNEKTEDASPDMDRTVLRTLYATILQAAMEPTNNWWEEHLKWTRLPSRAVEILRDIARVRRLAERENISVTEAILGGWDDTAAKYGPLLQVPVEEVTPEKLSRILEPVYADETLRRHRCGE